MTKQIAKLELELGMIKKHKNEKFYQAIVEKYLDGTHKVLKNGCITDVTTDDIHAEIKRWDTYQNAIGQLLRYNSIEPRNTLQVYLFGPSSKKLEKEAFEILSNLKIETYKFDLYEDQVDIIRLRSEDSEIVYSYKSSDD